MNPHLGSGRSSSGPRGGFSVQERGTPRSTGLLTKAALIRHVHCSAAVIIVSNSWALLGSC